MNNMDILDHLREALADQDQELNFDLKGLELLEDKDIEEIEDEDT